ncbi:MAG: Rho termination factor N-terminal domain-containing protein [Candidatus Brocadiales bacterium]|nr:Rho termination factor N-terminal domain-containing protein [Candidatus Brocadiales bacterium]
MDFTQEILSKLTVKKLTDLAKFQGIPVSGKLKKTDIISLILEAQPNQVVEDSMSVRIRRIKEQNRS